ncbi:MAG: efflux RND transporter periplasmic adaptor subunit [Planctomycetales bacterium]|nr:efflux RND transporter periplasmic adaptor subunit [Planctomycetales bacterium]
MSKQTHSARTSRRKIWTIAQNSASLIVVVLLLVGGFWGSHFLMPHKEHSEHSATEEALEKPTHVEITPEKVETAGIQVVPVVTQTVQHTKTVAATIDYDPARRVTIKAPVESVVGTCWVTPGQQVVEGDQLVTLSGAELALARSEIKKCQADLRIAKIGYDWKRETHDNLVALLDALKQEPSVSEVEVAFEGKRLGEHRDHLLTSYAKYQLASKVARRAKPLGEQGIVSASTAESRLQQRDVASTDFKTVREQSEFEASRDLMRAEAELAVAQQELAVAKERLRLLLGPWANQTESVAAGEFELQAPFRGKVEAVHTSAASRVAAGEPIVTLADISQLWVSALIHQHDWTALEAAHSQSVQVRVPALPDQTFAAQVNFVGAEVSSTTRAVSLVAKLNNDDAQFRPGMFAWVDLPMEPPRQSLVVPLAAIQRESSTAFVFIADGPLTFRRVDVEVGLETADVAEVTAGLSEGDQVVAAGAFYLKSELLLEQEEE